MTEGTQNASPESLKTFIFNSAKTKAKLFIRKLQNPSIPNIELYKNI